jgi:uncharacterized protein
MNLPQLELLQEIITLLVFVPFAVLYMRQWLHWDYAWELPAARSSGPCSP